MNPLRVWAANYRTFEQLDVELPTGTVAVTGPNGAGKSSILNLIDVALFADRGELPGLLTVGEDELEIGLVFHHGGELYRIRRQFSARGRGKTVLDFERNNLRDREDELGERADSWIPLTRETTQATQELICSTLGLSRATFGASSFLAQGDGAAFSEAAPRDRKAVLAEILGLGIWDRLQKHARDDLRIEEDALVKLAALIAGADEQAARKPEVLATLRSMGEAQTRASAALATAENELDDAQRAHAAAQVIIEQVRTAESEARAVIDAHFRASEDLAQAVAAAEALEGKRIELAEVSADAAQVPALEERLRELLAATAATQNAIAERDRQLREMMQRSIALERMGALVTQTRDEAESLRGKAAHLKEHIDEASSCDRCGQTLGAEAAGRAAASFRADATALELRANETEASCVAEDRALTEMGAAVEAIIIPAVEDPAPVEQTLREARAAVEKRAVLAEQIEQLMNKAMEVGTREMDLERTAAAVARKQDELDALKEQAIDETMLVARVGLFKVAVADARLVFDTRQAEIVRAQADLDRITEAEERLAEHRADVEAAQSRVDLLKLAERAYGRDGIPALIVENAAIPQIEAATNELLQMMPMADGTTFRVELRTQRALKTSDNLKETLDILIHAGDYVRPYETFSEGEHGRQNICLRIALSLLLAHRRGAESKLLAIDEIPYLDDLGKEQLVAVVQHVSSHFDRILMISHESALRDAFDQRIVVEKGDDGRSRIVEALERVPA